MALSGDEPNAAFVCVIFTFRRGQLQARCDSQGDFYFNMFIHFDGKIMACGLWVLVEMEAPLFRSGQPSRGPDRKLNDGRWCGARVHHLDRWMCGVWW